MIITDVESIILKQPVIDNVGDGSQDTILILVHTDEGITGIGEVDSSPYIMREIIQSPMSHEACFGLRELLIGEDPMNREKIWRKMYDKSIYYGRRSAAIHAMSGVDIAIQDVVGKKLGVPVSTLLGGAFRSEIQAYCSVLMPDSEDEIKRLVDKHMCKGYKGLKFGWGAFGQSFERDIQLVKWARKALGDDKKLMVDIGMLWTDVKGAIKTAKTFEEYGVHWIEEPFSPDWTDAYKTLRENTNVNIAGGEEVTTVYEYRELLDGGCVDVLQPDLSRCGGFTVASKLIQMADFHHVPIVPHAFKTNILMAATLQYIAALPNAWLLEFCEQDTILRQTLTSPIFHVEEDGSVKIPSRPGIGVDLNWGIVSKYRID